MARKKAKRKTGRGSGSNLRREDRGSVVLTVAWMLTALFTAVALVVVGAASVLLWQYPPETSDTQPFAFVPGLFLIIAATTGLLCLVLMPVVYRVRRDPPPRPIALGVLAVCVLPLATLAWKALAR